MRTPLLMLLAVDALATIFLSAAPQRGRPPELWINEVSPEFRLLYGGLGIPPNEIAGLWAGFPCDNISYEFKFEGGGARGDTGDYVMTFRKAAASAGATPVDGSAEIRVVSGGVQRYGIPSAGEYTGNVDIRTYGKICHLSKQIRFVTLADAYPIGIGVNFNVYDGVSYAVSVTDNGKTKRVSDRGFGPVELWSLQQAMDSAATRIRWIPK